ncbi:MAG TPA: hypothetical protein VHZ28_05095 [Terracidiphilus sp.]|jgi:hypothetical protein|nr:hypothetical protein [Terracidiphilus sp.]
MSLLHQESPGAVDDAGKGESLTRGTSRIGLAAIIATVVVTIAIGIYVIVGEKPPVATVQVIDIWAHPMHEVTPAFDAAGASVSQSTFDQVLVFTRIRLHNQSKNPIFLHQILTNITLPDGTIDSSFATTASQYVRIFKAYPGLAQWFTPPINTEMSLQPGQTEEGTFVSSFRMAKDQWDTRKALDFTFGFRYQPEVKVPAAGAVTDR